MENLPSQNTEIIGHIETIAILMSVGGYTNTTDYIYSLLNKNAFECINRADKVASRIIQVYFILQNKKQKSVVVFNYNTVVNIVKAIDPPPHFDGYLYEKKLIQDCQILFSDPVRSDGFWDEIILPIQKFYENRGIIHNTLIGTALGLYLIIMINAREKQEDLNHLSFASVLEKAFYHKECIDLLPYRIENKISFMRRAGDELQDNSTEKRTKLIDKEVNNV